MHWENKVIHNLEYPANQQLGCRSAIARRHFSDTTANWHLNHANGFHCIENKFRKGSIRIIFMPVIVPLSDDSISHALYYESLKNSLVWVRSFASERTEGRWFSAKTHKWDGEGWRKIAQGHLREEPCSVKQHWSFVFSLQASGL